MESFGWLRHLHEENVGIQQIIDEEFEQIEPLLHSRGSVRSAETLFAG